MRKLGRNIGSLVIVCLILPGVVARQADAAKATRVEREAALLARIEHLEKAVADLTLRLDELVSAARRADSAPAGGAPNEASTDSQDVNARRIEQLEETLATQARGLALLTELVNLTRADKAERAAAASAPEEVPPPAIAAEPQAPESPATAEQAYFLPSRSWAGGLLHYGGKEFKIETHGFLDLEYEDPGPQGSRGGVSSFDQEHANLFFTTRLRPNLGAHLEIEYEHSGNVVEIDQAFLSWEATRWLTLEAGRFYAPFGIERFVWYSPTNQLVSRPVAFRDIVPGNFYANGLRASGILRQGERPRFTYEVAVSDGLGDKALVDRRGSRQTHDNNSSRALTSRVAMVLWPRMEVGASYHTQRYASTRDLGLRFVGVDFAGRWKGVELRSEYVAASLEREVNLGPAADLKQRGGYVQLSYHLDWDREFLPGLSLVTRFEGVDLDRGVSGNDDRRLWSTGFNLKLYDHFRLKTEYQWAWEEGIRRDDNSFFSQFVLDF